MRKETMHELFSEDVLSKAIVKQFNYPSSIIAINKGNGQFTIQKLPPMAQISSINAIQQVDINKDGKIDLILVEINLIFHHSLEAGCKLWRYFN